MKMPKLVVSSALALVVSSTAVALAAPPVAFPLGYRGWNHVKSLVLEAGHPLADPFAGLHHVYVNDIGLPALRDTPAGKAPPIPDGTVLVFDLHEAAGADHALAEGARKFVGVMQKDTKAYPSTGGWGFELFKADTTDRGVSDGGASCWSCHAGQPGGVYSKWTK